MSIIDSYIFIVATVDDGQSVEEEVLDFGDEESNISVEEGETTRVVVTDVTSAANDELDFGDEALIESNVEGEAADGVVDDIRAAAEDETTADIFEEDVPGSASLTFQCVICGSQWDNAKKRNGHMATCKRKNGRKVSSCAPPVSLSQPVSSSFPCDVCGKSFPTARGTKSHRSRMHKGAIVQSESLPL